MALSIGPLKPRSVLEPELRTQYLSTHWPTEPESAMTGDNNMNIRLTPM